MMAYSEDHIALAAEYALGTLDTEERAQVETMMSVDKDFTAMVEAWEQKLGVLNQMVGVGRAAADRLGEHQGRDRTFRRAGAAGAARSGAAARRRDCADGRRCGDPTIPTSSSSPGRRGAGAVSRPR